MNRNNGCNSLVPLETNSLEKDFISSQFTSENGKPPPPPYPSAPPSQISPHPSSDYIPCSQDTGNIPQATSPQLSSEIFVRADTICNIDQSADKTPVCPRIMVQAETPCPPLINDAQQQTVAAMNSHVPVSRTL